MKRYVIKSDQPRQFLVNYKDDLNSEQYAVVADGKGPLLVIAGAGSGKTRTVTYRVARLIESGDISDGDTAADFHESGRARNVATRRGVGSIRCPQSVGRHFSFGGQSDTRRHSVSLGYQNNYTILDSEDTKDLLETCITQAGVLTKERRFPKGEVFATSSA